ncbi:alpha/beta hydrolase-fold protein [Lysobacter sp. S4-A87]|uniref:alpha/beta hydrolase n=1 Tax=Lysobacter sp. S4-A87 TaxID=2925843 RepID=UPI001F52C2D5|nr:alpha/beta hydrolase-fold protein [Lysobacter sp. S4-A87]UNK48055.1 alpha/beta hydrolase-fold protein [Lysobacter sp. S4-A87]
MRARAALAALALTASFAMAAHAEPVRVQLQAPAFAPEQVKVAVYLPPGYDEASDRRYRVLYINDGQDMAAVGLESTLSRLYADDAIEPVIVVAIDMLSDRMGTYGLSDRAAGASLPGTSRFGPIGARAHEYAQWLATTLVPYVDSHYRTRVQASDRTMLGWSLGALQAFDMGWQYPDLFARVGAFSPSFWLPPLQPGGDDRLAQGQVERGPKRDGLRMFIAVGSAEETDDRDHDGVFDALDDALTLIRGGRDGARDLRGLAGSGYPVSLAYAPCRQRTDIDFFLLDDGRHNQASWARMLPVFLHWAYATPAASAMPRCREYLAAPAIPEVAAP